MTLEISSGRAMRAGVPLRLPSGFVVAVRPVDQSLVLRLGYMPDYLTSLAAELTDEIRHAQNITEDSATTTAREVLKRKSAFDIMRQERELMEAFARAALVMPRIVDDPRADDEIGASDLTTGDLQFIYGACVKPYDELKRFSEEQAQPVEPVQHGENVEYVTESVGEPEPDAGNAAE